MPFQNDVIDKYKIITESKVPLKSIVPQENDAILKTTKETAKKNEIILFLNEKRIINQHTIYWNKDTENFSFKNNNDIAFAWSSDPYELVAQKYPNVNFVIEKQKKLFLEMKNKPLNRVLENSTDDSSQNMENPTNVNTPPDRSSLKSSNYDVAPPKNEINNPMDQSSLTDSTKIEFELTNVPNNNFIHQAKQNTKISHSGSNNKHTESDNKHSKKKGGKNPKK